MIELLVVIAIIALLLSILTPALNQVKERARRILCASALRQWGIAIVAYNVANDNLMFIPRRWGDIPYPHYFAGAPPRLYSIFPDDDEKRLGEFSVYLINPYIECVSKDFEETGLGSEILTCPNAGGDFIVEWTYATWDSFCAPPHNADKAYFIEPAYSYWNAGGPVPLSSSNNDCSLNALRDLTFDTLSPKRLLMSEILNLDGGTPWFRYNHGRDGWSWNLWWYPEVQPVPGHQKADGEQDATGRSQLFGDGRVVWKKIPLKFEDNIPSEQSNYGDYHENEWNGPGSGWVNYWDISWY